MSLPISCNLTDTHLVFWEMATEDQLVQSERLYEFCCTVACTNALRPMGMVEVVRHPIPEMADGETMDWGGRTLDADAARSYAGQGFLLCELRLPVQSMGMPVPPGVSAMRPPGT